MQEVSQLHMANLCVQNTGRSTARIGDLERNIQNLPIPTTRFARKFSTWNPPSHAEGAYSSNCMVEQPRNEVLERAGRISGRSQDVAVDWTA